jgi:hypothetical protein
MDVCFKCCVCVLSGRGFSDGLITRPDVYKNMINNNNYYYYLSCFYKTLTCEAKIA